MAETVSTHDDPQEHDLREQSTVVEFDNVSIKFDLKPVLEDISFKVLSGETRIILGPA